jgi:hypothetical protein
MTATGSDVEAFTRLVQSLRPWLDQVVFVGGWAHRLYRSHPLAQPVDRVPLMTRDADIALPVPKQRITGSIRDRLLEAGFQEQLSSDFKPPVTRYQLGTEHGGFYAEFLTPLVGSTTKRDGSIDATKTIAGVTAQKLRHLEPLMIAPWRLTPGGSSGLALGRRTTVLVPNVASYLVQKILIQSKRRSSRRPKDVLYMHDTIELFGRSLTEVRSDWIERVKPELAVRALRSVRTFAAERFEAIDDEIRDAAREATSASGRALSPDALAAVCREGLGAIFLDTD